jgi:hypothetical protein
MGIIYGACTTYCKRGVRHILLKSAERAICMVTGSLTTGTRTLLRGVVVVGAGSLTEGLGGKQLGEAPGESIYEANK